MYRISFAGKGYQDFIFYMHAVKNRFDGPVRFSLEIGLLADPEHTGGIFRPNSIFSRSTGTSEETRLRSGSPLKLTAALLKFTCQRPLRNVKTGTEKACMPKPGSGF
jgi:hypothetical protein